MLMHMPHPSFHPPGREHPTHLRAPWLVFTASGVRISSIRQLPWSSKTHSPLCVLGQALGIEDWGWKEKHRLKQRFSGRTQSDTNLHSGSAVELVRKIYDGICLGYGRRRSCCCCCRTADQTRNAVHTCFPNTHWFRFVPSKEANRVSLYCVKVMIAVVFVFRSKRVSIPCIWTVLMSFLATMTGWIDL